MTRDEFLTEKMGLQCSDKDEPPPPDDDDGFIPEIDEDDVPL
jgi:hypothetical protein